MRATINITGTVYSLDGVTPQSGGRLYVRKAVKDGVLLATADKVVTIGLDGTISFTLPRDSTAWIESAYIEGWAKSGGVALTIPDAASATLEELRPAVNAPSNAVSQSTFNAFRAMLSGARTVTESATLEADEFAVVADSEADIILALPPAADRELPYYVKNINAGLVTVDPDGIETINREPSLVIATGDAYIVVPAGGGWETW
jgi:hypothetical protein